MRALWPFGGGHSFDAANAAVKAAELSRLTALKDRVRFAEQRAVADSLADQVRQHNAANHYDDWLQRVIHGRD